MVEASPTETWKKHLTVWRIRYSNPQNCNRYLINRILTQVVYYIGKLKILGKLNCYKGGEERKGFAEG